MVHLVQHLASSQESTSPQSAGEKYAPTVLLPVRQADARVVGTSGSAELIDQGNYSPIYHDSYHAHSLVIQTQYYRSRAVCKLLHQTMLLRHARLKARDSNYQQTGLLD